MMSQIPISKVHETSPDMLGRLRKEAPGMASGETPKIIGYKPPLRRRASISTSVAKASFHKVSDAIDAGKTIAGAVEAVMDLAFIEIRGNEWIFVGSKDAPKVPRGKFHQDYFIDRINERLVAREEFEGRSGAGEYDKLPWHQKLCVLGSTRKAIRTGKPLALHFDGFIKTRLWLGPNTGSAFDKAARVAQKRAQTDQAI